MKKEVIEFWQKEDIPVSRMISRAPDYRLQPQQIERGAEIVYYELLELIENIPEQKPWMGYFEKNRNGTARWVQSKGVTKLVAFRNHFRPTHLGRRVYEIAKYIKGNGYNTQVRKMEEEILILKAELEAKKYIHKVKNNDFINLTFCGHWR